MKASKASIKKLNDIGIALSKEKNIDALLEMIVVGCKELTHADAGTLYLLIADSHLKFEIVHTDSLNYAMGGTTGVAINFPFIPLYKDDGEPNLRMVAAFAVLKDQAVNIADAYQSKEFDFSGTREFDKKTGYRSTSFLTIPMKDHNEEIIGALQLINATDPATSKIIPFSDDDLNLAKSLTSQAAVALSRKKLEDSLRQYVDLHKVINSILMIGWKKVGLQEQFSQVLKIILNIPALNTFKGGGIFFQASNPNSKSICMSQDVAADTTQDLEVFYQKFCQQGEYTSHEVVYLETPLEAEFDHLVIPLLCADRCSGAIFLKVPVDERLSWEKELFLLSATEPVATILERRQVELDLLQANQDKDQFISQLHQKLDDPLSILQENIQKALNAERPSALASELSEQLKNIQQASQQIQAVATQIDEFSTQKTDKK